MLKTAMFFMVTALMYSGPASAMKCFNIWVDPKDQYGVPHWDEISFEQQAGTEIVNGCPVALKSGGKLVKLTKMEKVGCGYQSDDKKFEFVCEK